MTAASSGAARKPKDDARMTESKALAERLEKIRIELCIAHQVKPDRRYCKSSDSMHWNTELYDIAHELNQAALEDKPTTDAGLIERLEA